MIRPGAGLQLSVCLCALACTPAPPPAAEPVQTVQSAEPIQPVESAPPAGSASADSYDVSETTVGDDGSVRYGPPLSPGEPLALASLLGAPGDYADKVVKVRGTVTRVCQNMGCWVEIRNSDDDRLRVPMAGHALFISQRSLGRTATVEGTVVVRPLTEAQKAHYASEGMTATDVAVSISATSLWVAK